MMRQVKSSRFFMFASMFFSVSSSRAEVASSSNKTGLPLAIALATESGIDYGGRLCFDSLSYRAEPESALSAAACVAAAQARAKAVVALTNSEITAALIAARRVQCGIVTVSSDKGVLRHNSLNWGVQGLYAPEKARSVERLALAAAAVGAVAGVGLVVLFVFV